MQSDAATPRFSGWVSTLAYDLWPATDEARDREAELIAAAVPGAFLALVGLGDSGATFAPSRRWARDLLLEPEDSVGCEQTA